MRNDLPWDEEYMQMTDAQKTATLQWHLAIIANNMRRVLASWALVESAAQTASTFGAPLSAMQTEMDEAWRATEETIGRLEERERGVIAQLAAIGAPMGESGTRHVPIQRNPRPI